MAPTATTSKKFIVESIQNSSRVLSRLEDQLDGIDKVAEVLVSAYRKGRKMVLFGNGGSAADAQHLATELLGGFIHHNRRSLPALALTTDTSALTAISNDYGFEEVFARQVDALVEPGDVVIALSTSGCSKNVIQGANAAREKKALVVGLTGESGGLLKAQCDYCLCVPSRNTAYVQQAHITIGHILCALVEQALT